MNESSEQGPNEYSQLDYREMLMRIFKVAELINKSLHKDERYKPEVDTISPSPDEENQLKGRPRV